jgi:serine/threonine protein kinase/tetratricopeptide (TPR) repeat protein
MIGETISHYEILEKLGEGGMGVVYKARDLDLDRFVAIKFLPPHFSTDEDAIKRFVHEAKAASSLNHSNIGVIHEIGRTDDGQTFIVMACYDGETLRERIDRGGIALEGALDIALQIAAGLAKAHEKEIVHRDIKPSNILVTGDGEVKIIDFGLAKLAGKTRLTREDSTVGTAAYMSPEQARGEDVDHRSDIFSLGVILYEMLAGTPPFRGEHEAALLYEIVHEEPEPLSGTERVIPAELQLIVDRALMKDPGNRYQEVLEFKNELSEFKANTTSRETSRGDKSGRYAGSRRILKPWVMASLILAVIAISVTAYLLTRPSETEELSLAVIDFRDLAEPDEILASAEITELLHVGLVENSPIRVISPALLHDLRRRLFGSSRGVIDGDQVLEVVRESKAAVFLWGSIKTGAGQYVLWQLVDTRTGNSIAAHRINGDNIARLADQVVSEVLPLLADRGGTEVPSGIRPVSEMTTKSPEAYKYYVAGLLAREATQWEEAIRNFELALEYDSTFALALHRLSEAYYSSAARGQIVNHFADKAWEFRAHLGVKDLLLLKAWRQRLDWRIEEALATYREILDLWPDDPEVLAALIMRLYYYWYWEEAGQIAINALRLYPDDLGIASPGWPSMALSGHMDEAFISIQAFISRHPGQVSGWEELGWRHLEIGQPDSAEAAFKEVLKIDSGNIWGQRGIAACHYQRGDLERSRESLEQILRRSDLMPTTHIQVICELRQAGSAGLSWIFAEGGCFNKALELFEDARQLVVDPIEEVRLERERSYLLRRIGRADEVLQYARSLEKSAESRYASYAALELLAISYSELDSVEAAHRAIEKYVDDRWGNYPSYLKNMIDAETALTEGDPDRALAALDELRRMGAQYLGGLRTIEYRENLARAHRLNGNLGKAVEAHKELLRVFAGHALSHYELGKLYEEMGRSTDARREYERFLKMWSQADEGLPQPEDARRRLASLTSR